MKVAYIIVLAVLTLLAISSGIAKVLLVPREVEFFGQFGFTNSILIAYGSLQLIGGLLLPFRKTRFAGAAIVAMTFLVSLVVLLMDGNVPASMVTFVAILLLGMVMKQSLSEKPSPE